MKLIGHLPAFWQNTPEVVELLAALDPAAEAAAAAGESFLQQLNVTTATWGLDTWEEALGIDKEAGKTLEYRRARIMAKLRGAGTATPQMIENVAASFSGRKVEIIEHNADAVFEIKFVDVLGIPPDMEDLTAAIEEIKPAHLAYFFTYLFRKWGEVAEKTWGALAPYTWDDILQGVI